jgi:hypothetical protein
VCFVIRDVGHTEMFPFSRSFFFCQQSKSKQRIFSVPLSSYNCSIRSKSCSHHFSIWCWDVGEKWSEPLAITLISWLYYRDH